MIGNLESSRLSRPIRDKSLTAGREDALLYLLNMNGHVELMAKALIEAETTGIPIWQAVSSIQSGYGLVPEFVTDLINRGMRSQDAETVNKIIETIDLNEVSIRVVETFATIVANRAAELSNALPFLRKCHQVLKASYNGNWFSCERSIAVIERGQK